MITEITPDNFETQIANGIVLVDFWAPWCGPCRMLSPLVDEIAEELKDSIKVCKCNVDNCREIAESFNIMSIPTLLLFENGKLIDKKSGVQPKQSLINWIKNNFNTYFNM